MPPEQLVHELLGLNWEVVGSRFDQQSGPVFLEIREPARLWESVRCPQDTSGATCYDHSEVLTWRHRNIFQHRCEITGRLPRGKCRQCGHVFRVRPPWEGLSTHFTKEFAAFTLLLMREMPLSKVADLLGETDTRLWRRLFRQVDVAHAEARLGGPGVWAALHKSQRLWRKNPENLPEKEAARRAGIDQKSLRTARV